MKRHTKIVATLGPATATRERIHQLRAAGMNVARLNCSHGDWESKREWIAWIRETDGDGLAPVAILADLQGPKFRIGQVADGALSVADGATLTMGRGDVQLPVPDDEIFSAMRTGDRVLFGDGDVEIKLGAQREQVFEAKVINGGVVKTRQGITLVGKSFDVPCLTEKDRQDVYEAVVAGADYLALSYVRRAADMRELKQLVAKYDPSVRLVAKIETREALKELDEILKVTDVVMVARGDLGLQMETEDVPVAQKRIILKCNQAGVPVITATQMLESMVSNLRPTRAEASDVANAILDGTDAVMLSGETAAGSYPIESVKTMARIAEKTEALLDYDKRLVEQIGHHGVVDSTDAVANAAVTIANGLKVKAILTTSASGTTPRMVSKYRPRVPVYCAAWNERVQRQTALMWGVESVCMELPETTDDVVHGVIGEFLRRKRLKVGDTVVMTEGFPPGKPGHTNMILVQTV